MTGVNVSTVERMLEFDDPRAALPDDALYGPPCPHCGGQMVVAECEECDGEGTTYPGQLHELDPLWYDRDDVEDCHMCLGRPRWWVCSNTYEWCIAHPSRQQSVTR